MKEVKCMSIDLLGKLVSNTAFTGEAKNTISETVVAWFKLGTTNAFPSLHNSARIDGICITHLGVINLSSNIAPWFLTCFQPLFMHSPWCWFWPPRALLLITLTDKLFRARCAPRHTKNDKHAVQPSNFPRRNSLYMPAARKWGPHHFEYSLRFVYKKRDAHAWPRFSIQSTSLKYSCYCPWRVLQKSPIYVWQSREVDTHILQSISRARTLVICFRLPRLCSFDQRINIGNCMPIPDTHDASLAGRWRSGESFFARCKYK